ncbi:uncharacterized protein LOC134817728 [Bolinopsis microptera]|uniref:uncharacterized protein LOC134817728 n=1 Tax=Bolinopsis microptera TaxID=2820187 RepID=UPI003079E2DF
MVNSSDLTEDRGESPNFLDSLASFKDRFISEAEELFSISDSRPNSRSSRLSRQSRQTTLSTSSFDFSFPWSTKPEEPEENFADVLDEEEDYLENGDEPTCYAPRNDRYSVASKRQSTATARQSTTVNNAKGRGRLKRDSSICIKNGKVENGTLLQYSALTLTIQKIKPGDIPSFPEIIDDLHCLEGADPEQVQLIVDKLEALKLTIASLDKRLQSIDRGLDRLKPTPLSE